MKRTTLIILLFFSSNSFGLSLDDCKLISRTTKVVKQKQLAGVPFEKIADLIDQMETSKEYKRALMLLATDAYFDSDGESPDEVYNRNIGECVSRLY